MPVDFTKYRVDVNDALQNAISSRETNQVQTETTNMAINARTAALHSAGAAIGKGLSEAFDPTRDLARQSAIRNNQAQLKDMADENASRAIRSQASYQKGEQVLGLNHPDYSAIGRQVFTKNTPHGISYDELPPDTRRAYEGELAQIGNQDMLVNKASDKQVLALGAKWGSPQNVGLTQSQGKQQLTEAGMAAANRLFNDPSYKKLVFEKNERNQAIQDSLQHGDYKTATFIQDYPNDKKRQAMAPEVYNFVESGEEYDFPEGTMTVEEWVGQGNGTLPNVWREWNRTVDKYPALGIHGEGDKQTIKTTWDADVVKNAAAKDTEFEPIARALGGHPFRAAYSDWSGVQGAQRAVEETQKGLWAKKLKGQQSVIAQARINTLNAHIAKHGMAAVAAVAANMSGTAKIPESALIKNKIFSGKDSLAAIRTNLEAIAKLSPESRGLFTKSLDPTKPNQIQIYKNQAYQEGMAPGPIEAGPGIFGRFKQQGVDPGDLAVLFESAVKSNTKRPNFALLQGQLMSGGLPADVAKKIATGHAQTFEEALNVGMSTPDGRGITPNEWPKDEQEQLKHEIADDYASNHIAEYNTAKSFENSDIVNFMADKPEGTLSYNDASQAARDAIKANPDLKTHDRVDVATEGGGAIVLHNGEAFAQRLPNGDYRNLKAPDPNQQKYTEALHVGARIYEARREDAVKKGNPNPSKFHSGDDKVDAIMKAPIPGGLSVYDAMEQMLQKHPTMGSKSDDWGISAYTHLTNLAAEQGLRPFELSKAMNDAALKQNDPVLEGIASFLAEQLSPQPNTRKAMDLVEGHAPTDMIRAAGAAQAQEDTQKQAGGGGKPKQAYELAQQGQAAAQAPAVQTKNDEEWSYPDMGRPKTAQEETDEKYARGDPNFRPGEMLGGATTGVIAGGLMKMGPFGAAAGAGLEAMGESTRVRDLREARARIIEAKWQHKFGHEGPYGDTTMGPPAPESGPASRAESRPESRAESRPSPTALKGKAPESRPGMTQEETHALAMGRTFGSMKTREEQAREYAEAYRVQGGGLSDKDTAAYAEAKKRGDQGAAEAETMHRVISKLAARGRAGPDKSTSPGRAALINADRSKPDAKGRIAEGNIDMNDRVGMVDEEGRTATVRSISIEVSGREVLIPTISPLGTLWTNEQAVQNYYKSGKHLGIFKDVESANRAAEELHQSEEKKFEHTPRLTSISAGPRPSILNAPEEKKPTRLDVFQEAERRAQEIRRKEKGAPTEEEYRNRPREMMNPEDKMFPIKREPVYENEPVDWNWKPEKKKEEKKKEDKKKESPNRRAAPVGEPRYGAG